MSESTWQKSSYSNNGQCFEIAETGEAVAVRSSQRPDRRTLTFDGPGMAAWIAGCTAGEFDDLT